jgi:hypothetical protein
LCRLRREHRLLAMALLMGASTIALLVQSVCLSLIRRPEPRVTFLQSGKAVQEHTT